MLRQCRLDFLVGRWTDSNESSYDVELDLNGFTCSVTTTRLTGKKRYTKALIQNYNDCIYWGRNYELQRWSDCANEICWSSARRRDFLWRRVRTTIVKLLHAYRTSLLFLDMPLDVIAFHRWSLNFHVFQFQTSTYHCWKFYVIEH